MKIRPHDGRYTLANVSDTARRDSDFAGPDEGLGELIDSGRLRVIVPPPTKADRERFNMPAIRWEDSRGAEEYRDSFRPAMCALWPIDPYRDDETAAALMNEHAGATCLLHLDDDSYFIGMTGGGMDLSWHLAAAYVCCGNVPPVEILSALNDSPFHLAAPVTREILRAWRHAEAWAKERARRLSEKRRATVAALRKSRDAA